MKKPYMKEELLALEATERKKLDDALAALPEAAWLDDSVTDAGWGVKDVLAHLFAWEEMFQGWYAAGLRGEVPQLPALGYKWNQTPALNQHIFEKHKDRSAAEIREDFNASCENLRSLIAEIPDEDLTALGRYAWTGKWTLSEYADAVGGRHYRWASDMIRKWAKKRAAA